MKEPETPLRVGIFPRLATADRAVERLLETGFPAERISVICPECSEDAFPAQVEREEPAGSHTREAAIGGGITGAVLGGLTAGVGIAASGGIGLLVAGPLLGAAGAGAVAGGFIGAMTTRGMEPEIADFYDQALGKGQILVAVDTAPGDGIPPARRAERVLEECGAEPVPLREG